MSDAELEESAWIAGKDPRLEVLSAAPLVLETPIGLLAQGRLTDKRFLFVRNVQDVPQEHTLDARPNRDWQIELVGLLEPSRIVVQAEDLAEMDQVEYEMVLQCSGNGRSRYRDTPGTRWAQGGVANVRFGGVPLAAVLERHGVALDPTVRYVTAEGHRPSPERGTPSFEHSLPIGDVLARSILALTLNGEPLAGIHGGPVRLVTPGFFGTMQVKWLTRLHFETTESTSYYHATEYRVPLAPVQPGEPFEFTLENSRPTWSIRLMSYIFDPLPGASLAAGSVTVSGVTYNDGSAPIESVVVSIDRGRTWQPARLEPPDSPYAWYPWSADVVLEPGAHQIWSRATDQLGRTQPLDGSVDWNPNGYEWAGVFKTDVTVERLRRT